MKKGQKEDYFFPGGGTVILGKLSLGWARVGKQQDVPTGSSVICLWHSLHARHYTFHEILIHLIFEVK